MQLNTSCSPNGLRGFFVTGTDTDAGKTLVTAGLACLLGARVIKPVQTGCLPDPTTGSLLAPDVVTAQRFGVQACALHLYAPPCSPHLAAGLAGESLSVRALADEIRACAAGDPVLVEGAGGAAVPINDHESMLDLMQALGLPVIVAVANRLGCLNHALLTLEALQARGLQVAGVILNRTSPEDALDAGCGEGAAAADEARILDDNPRSLAHWAGLRHVPLLATVPWLEQDDRAQKLAAALAPAAVQLSRNLAIRVPQAADLASDSVTAFDRDHLWHPYTSASHPLPVREVVATHDNRLVLADGTELIDGMSSWWCCVHGYGNKALQAAMARQLHQMSHVMFGGLTHKPAVELGKRLLGMVPRGLEWLFYADSGSVAVEVALKMAVQYQYSKGRTARQRFLTPMGGYHGDTQGAMSVCDPINGMHTLFTGILPRHVFAPRPSCRLDAPFDPASLEAVRELVATHAHELAGIILEPIVQGAGGMWFYHPDYVRGIKALCEEHDLVLICDEIATGFGRTGKLFACEWAGITPDILCLGKALTGGMMTGAVTLATAKVAHGIGQGAPEAGSGLLMHGPTFMGNPLFCAAACASLDQLLASPWQERVHNLEAWLKEGLAPCRGKPGVRDVRVLGAIGVVEVERPVDMAKVQDFFVEQGVWIRPFDHNVYVMPPFVTPRQDAQALCRAICLAVDQGVV